MPHIRYRLDELLTRYNLSAYRLALEIKQRPETIRAMRNNQLRRLNEPLLLALCGFFYQLDPHFTLGDLLVYVPDDENEGGAEDSSHAPPANPRT